MKIESFWKQFECQKKKQVWEVSGVKTSEGGSWWIAGEAWKEVRTKRFAFIVV
jgi:hypothetical protein